MDLNRWNSGGKSSSDIFSAKYTLLNLDIVWINQIKQQNWSINYFYYDGEVPAIGVYCNPYNFYYVRGVCLSVDIDYIYWYNLPNIIVGMMLRDILFFLLIFILVDDSSLTQLQWDQTELWCDTCGTLYILFGLIVVANRRKETEKLLL